MRIVQVCGWYFPDSLGGTETYVAALASRLREAGHHSIVAAPDPNATAERTYQHDGMTVFRYPIPARPTRAEAQHLTPARGAERLHAWLREIRPDVVHFHTFVTGAGPHEIRAAKATGARVIATTHSGSLGFICQRGTMMQWGRRVCDGLMAPSKCAACELQHRGMPRPVADLVGCVPPAAGRLLTGLGKAGTTLGMSSLIAHNASLQADMLARVDRFVVLTEWARRAAVANDGVGAPIVLNRLGIRASAAAAAEWRQRPRAERDHLTVAYLGRFDRIKGVHDLARAIRALGPQVPIRFEFRGPVSNVRELQVTNELKALVGPDAWVRFLPPVGPDEVFEYLHGIDVLCCPSVALEGGPTVALEAMAVGTPVIATHLTALREIVEDGVSGRLLPPGDWRALAAALRAIANDRAATIDRWRAALPPLRTMDDVAADYLRLYRA